MTKNKFFLSVLLMTKKWCTSSVICQGCDLTKVKRNPEKWVAGLGLPLV